MGRLTLIAAVAALLFGAGSAAPAPAPGRAAAVAELQAAIEDERRALELLTKKPPRLMTAYDRLESAQDRLTTVLEFATGAVLPASVEVQLREANRLDSVANGYLLTAANEESRSFVRRALGWKALALESIRTATAPSGTPQCSDGKDNDRDGIVDWTLEPGCTSARDLREQSPFSCDVESRIASGRLALTGTCSGAFSEVDFTLLDGIQLNGRFDISHAPSCGAARPTGVRCKTKEGGKNPKHLLDARFATTSKDPLQRVQLRFFDVRKRQIARFVVPPMR